jgi:hypothetical protein
MMKKLISICLAITILLIGVSYSIVAADSTGEVVAAAPTQL